MHLGDRQWRDRANGVVDGDRGVAVGAGVDDDAGGLLSGLVYPVDQDTFMVRLAEVDLYPKFFAGVPAVLSDGIELRRAIDPLLALAEHVEIGTIEDEDR